jgi:hypothetical protein
MSLATFQGAHGLANLHVAFKIPYVYYFISELCRQQTEVIQNHENENVRDMGTRRNTAQEI